LVLNTDTVVVLAVIRIAIGVMVVIDADVDMDGIVMLVIVSVMTQPWRLLLLSWCEAEPVLLHQRRRHCGRHADCLLQAFAATVGGAIAATY
jgi:hypothetical protein